jgi:hypothetical protein
MPAVPIEREDYDAAGLRKLAARAEDAKAARRLLAIALMLEGASRTDATRAAGMDRQTLRDWVHRYNAGGRRRCPTVGPRPGAEPDPGADRAADHVGRGRSGPGDRRGGALAPPGPGRPNPARIRGHAG